jgi:hypothetical protein
MSKAPRRAGPRAKAAPPLPASAEPRMTELIGLDEDGNMALWDTGNVQPVTAFEVDGRWIKSGHYVIQWKGHAITVHCGNTAGGLISVQFMCSRNWTIYLPRPEVEAMLLGKVLRDPEHVARLTALIDMAITALHAQAHAPHRRRGRI